LVFYYDIKLKYISVNLLAIIVLYQNMFFETMTDAYNGLGIEGRKGPVAFARSKKNIKISTVVGLALFVAVMAFTIGFTDDGFIPMLFAPLASMALAFSLVNIALLPKYNDIDESEGMMPYEIVSSKGSPILVKISKRVDARREDFQEMKWFRVILEEPAFNRKMSLALLLAIPSTTIPVALFIALLFSTEHIVAVLPLLFVFSVFFLYNYIKMCRILKGDVVGEAYIAFCRQSGNFVYMDVPLEMLKRTPKKNKNKVPKS